MLRSLLNIIRRIGDTLSGRTPPQRWRHDRMRDDLDDYRIPWQLDGEPCEVYLFERWGSYSHPVLPLDPLTHIEVLQTNSVCRAFVRDLGGEPLMIRFACYAAHNTEMPAWAPLAPGPYAVEDADDGSPRPGAPLDRITAAMSDRLILVKQERPGEEVGLSLRELKWTYSFEYEYDANGVIQKIYGVDEESRKEIP